MDSINSVYHIKSSCGIYIREFLKLKTIRNNIWCLGKLRFLKKNITRGKVHHSTPGYCFYLRGKDSEAPSALQPLIEGLIGRDKRSRRSFTCLFAITSSQCTVQCVAMDRSSSFEDVEDMRDMQSMMLLGIVILLLLLGWFITFFPHSSKA